MRGNERLLFREQQVVESYTAVHSAQELPAGHRADLANLSKEIGIMSSSRKVLRLPGVQGITGLGRSTLYKAIKEGAFPPSIALGKRAVGWLESDVQEWLDSRIALPRSSAVQRRSPWTA
jgi:prophage regulatory protein